MQGRSGLPATGFCHDCSAAVEGQFRRCRDCKLAQRRRVKREGMRKARATQKQIASIAEKQKKANEITRAELRRRIREKKIQGLEPKVRTKYLTLKKQARRAETYGQGVRARHLIEYANRIAGLTPVTEPKGNWA